MVSNLKINKMENKTKHVSMYEINKTVNELRNLLKEKYLDESQEKENYLDLPMRVCMLYGVMHLHGVGEEDEVLYYLHLHKDVNTGNLSIKYKGDDGTFLSHKKVIKAIKKENNL